MVNGWLRGCSNQHLGESSHQGEGGTRQNLKVTVNQQISTFLNRVFFDWGQFSELYPITVIIQANKRYSGFGKYSIATSGLPTLCLRTRALLQLLFLLLHYRYTSTKLPLYHYCYCTTTLYCQTVLYCTILHYTVLYYSRLHYTSLKSPLRGRGGGPLVLAER